MISYLQEGTYAGIAGIAGIAVSIYSSSFDRVVQISTVVLAFFTILLFGASVGLVLASKKTMRIELLAHISFKESLFLSVRDATNQITS